MSETLLVVQVRFLVNELRKQVDTHVSDLASELEAQSQHASQGDPDNYIFKVDQKLLPPVVGHPAPSSCTHMETLPSLAFLCPAFCLTLHLLVPFLARHHVTAVSDASGCRIVGGLAQLVHAAAHGRGAPAGAPEGVLQEGG